ncbi:MAG: CoA transferase [Chloroflexi bacterium]|nr:CoA transferase [Chloroflexota bacterium]
MAGPCAGLTVLDFSWGMPGAIATLVLSDFGARVIKVEPPTGDPFRRHPGWLAWNRGKQGIVLDLKTPEGRDQAQRLAGQADVLVESFRPGVAQRLGIDAASLSQANHRLVYCSLSGFGQQGRLRHLKGYEGIVAAKSGRMLSFAGQTQREGPVYAAVQVASWAASQAAVWGILAALRLRERTGRGQWVQTSLLQGMIPHEPQALLMRQLTRRDPVRFPEDTVAARLRVPSLQYLPAPCKDGRWLQLANLLPRQFQSLIRVMGLWHIYRDERFRDAPYTTPEDREVLRDIILDRIREKTLDEWMALFVEDGDVAVEPFLPTTEGMKHPQFVHNRHVVELADPRVGPMKQLGLLVDLAETPGAIQGPAPDLGQHTAEVLARLASGPRPLAAVAGAGNGHGPAPRLPLEGITVLEFATVIAGPYSTVMLADLGARVIKVEAPEGDPLRRLTGAGGQGVGTVRTTAGKESIQVDLKTEEGLHLVRQLIARSDVLLHNFRPGVPERLGIDAATCHALNPRLIYVYAAGYGATGPQQQRPSFHPVPGALLGGALRQAGRAMPPPPETPLSRDQVKEVSRWLSRANETNPDPNTSMAITTGIMLALYARERTGQGQAVHTTMLVANGYANADEAFDYPGRPPWSVPDADCYGLHALYRLYPARQGWVFLACLFQREWETFCRTVDRPDLLTDPRFQTEAARQAHDTDLSAELAQVFLTRSAAEWENLLTAADVACVQADRADMGTFFEEDPHVRENRLVVPAERAHLRFGDYLRHGGLVHFSELAGRYGSGVLAGEHTRPLLQELGYSDEQIDDLWARGVVTWEDVDPIVAG